MKRPEELETKAKAIAGILALAGTSACATMPDITESKPSDLGTLVSVPESGRSFDPEFASQVREATLCVLETGERFNREDEDKGSELIFVTDEGERVRVIAIDREIGLGELHFETSTPSKKPNERCPNTTERVVGDVGLDGNTDSGALIHDGENILDVYFAGLKSGMRSGAPEYLKYLPSRAQYPREVIARDETSRLIWQRIYREKVRQVLKHCTGKR